LLVAGLLLIGFGLVFVLRPVAGSAGHWAAQLLPAFLVLAGAVRIASFAFYRKPKTPFGGMLLLVLGGLWFAFRSSPGIGILGIYGRYWPVLLLLFGATELIRYYSHRQTEGGRPRLFSPGRVVIILLIAASGVAAGQLATRIPSTISVNLDGLVADIRESVSGQSFSFTDPPAVVPLPSGARIKVTNSFGDLKLVGGAGLRATLTKRIRALSEEEGRRTADQVRLVIDQDAEGGCVLSTNRDEIDRDINTDIEIELPPRTPIEITTSFGNLIASQLDGPVSVIAQHGSVDIGGIALELTIRASHCDISARQIGGNLSVSGARRVRINGVEGAVDLAARDGNVDVRNIAGPVTIEASRSAVVADSLSQQARLKTNHASVTVARAMDVAIDAPHSDVRADNIKGSLLINTSHGDVRLRDVGSFAVSAERSSVAADGVKGTADIVTSHGDVTIKNFHERVQVKTSRKDVKLISGADPQADIDVENERGEIRISLPSSSLFDLEATSRSGRVRHSGFGLPRQGSRESAVIQTAGTGAPKIRLRTTHKNIVIEATGEPRSFAGRVGGAQ
jgi:hypothetical protein